MPRVFATQLPHQRIAVPGGGFTLEPKFKLGEMDPMGRALRERYGAITWLLDPNNAPWTPGVMDRLRLGLRDFCAKDHLLQLGNPILMSMMAVFAADHTDTLNFLQWSNGDYVSLQVQVGEPLDLTGQLR
jgi:hypothetical protein